MFLIFSIIFLGGHVTIVVSSFFIYEMPVEIRLVRKSKNGAVSQGAGEKLGSGTGYRLDIFL